MDIEKVKLIVRNMELLVDSLKAEIYSDSNTYSESQMLESTISDYDEIYEDDDKDYGYFH